MYAMKTPSTNYLIFIVLIQMAIYLISSEYLMWDKIHTIDDFRVNFRYTCGVP